MTTSRNPRGHHRWALLTAALGLAALCAGCAGEPTTDVAPHDPPTRAADCNDLPALGGDPGILLGTDWSGEHHAFGDTVVVLGCASPSLGGRVSLVTDAPGIRVRPRDVAVDPTGSGIVAFRVTVSSGASGALRIQQDAGGGAGGDLEGPVVAVDGDGWHLVRHDP